MGKGCISQIHIHTDFYLHSPNAGDIVKCGSQQNRCKIDSGKYWKLLQLSLCYNVVECIPLKTGTAISIRLPSALATIIPATTPRYCRKYGKSCGMPKKRTFSVFICSPPGSRRWSDTALLPCAAVHVFRSPPVFRSPEQESDQHSLGC